MVLRLEAEEVTQYTDDLDADAKRDLLACLLHTVDEVLLFFRTVSEPEFQFAAAQREWLHDAYVAATALLRCQGLI